MPNSELIVARTAYKDNKSKYSINERTSNYTEVTTLLKDRGIDLTHKRFLILQVRAQCSHVSTVLRVDLTIGALCFLSLRVRLSLSRR